MASIYDLKPKFQAILRPLTNGLAKAGVTANQITILAVILSCISGGLIARYPLEAWPLFIVPVVLFVRMALNAIDGMLAREHNQKTKLGAVLNELGDVVADTALYLPFALLPQLWAPLVVVIVILAIISEMTGVIGIQIGASRRYDGPLGKSDRAFVFGLLALLFACGLEGGPWTNVVLAILIALGVFTISNRANSALKEVPR